MDKIRTDNRWKDLKYKIFRMVSIGTISDTISRSYDIVGSIVLVINLIASFMLTFEELKLQYGGVLSIVESVTVFLFGVDYVLRLITADCLYPDSSPGVSVLRFIKSGSGIIDLLSFLPYYLPFFFPAGATAFRMFRVARIFRLFRINAYYDSMNVITSVLNEKKQQLLSSVFIILILMLASSLCMYSVEHEAQPEVFRNAFSGLWWSSSTLLTVGYGDIYPITIEGKILGMIITFLGVGMVAIPTGIISAGFVEHYHRIKRLSEYGLESSINFIEVKLNSRDSWTGRTLKECALPHGMFVSIILRGNDTIVPHGNQLLQSGDRLIVAAESLKEEKRVDLKEIQLKKNHPWNGELVRDLNISRMSVIVLIKRKGKSLIPRGEVMLCEGDKVLMYSRKNLHDEEEMAADMDAPIM